MSDYHAIGAPFHLRPWAVCISFISCDIHSVFRSKACCHECEVTRMRQKRRTCLYVYMWVCAGVPSFFNLWCVKLALCLPLSVTTSRCHKAALPCPYILIRYNSVSRCSLCWCILIVWGVCKHYNPVILVRQRRFHVYDLMGPVQGTLSLVCNQLGLDAASQRPWWISGIDHGWMEDLMG